ncbi:unnamed protein product, partial [Rotaria magnacalcarata]
TFILFELAQRQGWVQEPEVEPDDLSSKEWAEWNKIKLSAQTVVDNNS